MLQTSASSVESHAGNDDCAKIHRERSEYLNISHPARTVNRLLLLAGGVGGAMLVGFGAKRQVADRRGGQR